MRISGSVLQQVATRDGTSAAETLHALALCANELSIVAVTLLPVNIIGLFFLGFILGVIGPKKVIPETRVCE